MRIERGGMRIERGGMGEGEERNETSPLNPLSFWECGEEDILGMSCICKDTIFELNVMDTLIIIFFQFFLFLM